MSDFIQVFTTTSRKEEADTIAAALVDRRLAACVQVVGPMTSVYRWQGKVETSQEWLCVIKSRESLYPALEEAIEELHSYEVPEIVALPIVAGSAAYLSWLEREVKPAN